MMDRLGAFAERLLRSNPSALLAYGMVISVLDAAILYSAAAREGVLHIRGGVGLLENYGILSTLAGNALLLYLVSRYYKAVRSIWASKAVIHSQVIERSLSSLAAQIAFRGRARFIVYGFIVTGALAWLSNVTSHLLGDQEVRWAGRVFDSPEYPLTFLASRLHNLLTWVVIMPLAGHVVVVISEQLRRLMARAVREDAVKYDLLNPDQRGGFGFIDRAALAFNTAALLVYCQITLHIGTFKVNPDHIASYVLATVLVISVNMMFFGGLRSMVKELKLEALNEVKEKVFLNDQLSLEVLKYCYSQRVDTLAVLNFLINPGAVVTSGIVKLWPFLGGVITP